MQGLIRLYQVSLSPLLPSRCRFHPTCSAYAHEAFGKYGFATALRKTLWRLLRCHPFSRGGLDLP
ncbi:MAG: membrane protein insertion efficiency factor YidD [bacterium]|nr:membrane protein insertion efficiency factor YidD [bacterium]